MSNVFDRVKQTVGSSAQQIQDELVNLLVRRELDKRVSLLDSALSKLDELRKNLNKIKPDNVLYDETGAIVQNSYTKAKLDEKKKATEKVEKLDKAIESALALSAPDAFQKLKEAVEKS